MGWVSHGTSSRGVHTATRAREGGRCVSSTNNICHTLSGEKHIIKFSTILSFNIYSFIYLDLSCSTWDFHCRVQDLSCGTWDLHCRVRDLSCGTWDLHCRVQDLSCSMWDLVP